MSIMTIPILLCGCFLVIFVLGFSIWFIQKNAPSLTEIKELNSPTTIQKLSRVVVIINSIFSGLLLIPLILIAPYSLLALYNPSNSPNEINVLGWLFVSFCFSIPLIFIASLIASWLAYKKEHFKQAIFWGLIPVVILTICLILNLLSGLIFRIID